MSEWEFPDVDKSVRKIITSDRASLKQLHDLTQKLNKLNTEVYDEIKVRQEALKKYKVGDTVRIITAAGYEYSDDAIEWFQQYIGVNTVISNTFASYEDDKYQIQISTPGENEVPYFSPEKIYIGVGHITVHEGMLELVDAPDLKLVERTDNPDYKKESDD
jgi:hypothetical protein